jgi:peptidoglycan/xylan/chitin deacetylase (PgdA/CDA1 family)
MRSSSRLAAAAAAGYWFPAASAVLRPLGAAFDITYRETTRNAVSLTFDDGPHPQGTPAVLDTLERYGARATFFLVGEQVLRYPALAAEIVAAGHRIGLHCHRHRLLLRLAPWTLENDLRRAEGAIVDAVDHEIRSIARRTESSPCPHYSPHEAEAGTQSSGHATAATGAAAPRSPRSPGV